MRRVGLLVVGFFLLAGMPAAVSGGVTRVEARWLITDLGTLGGQESEATGINDVGQIVGWAETSVKGPRGQLDHAFLWKKGKMRDLGTLGGPESRANAINSRGQIVGEADAKMKDNEGPISHAFLWQGGRMRDLGTLGGPRSEALDINARGQIVGWSETRAKNPNDPRFHLRHAFLWEKGKMADLGTLGGPDSSAHAINDRGQIVGSADTRAKTREYGFLTPVEHAFLWKAGHMRDLGTVKGPRCEAEDINEHGQIVGSLDTGKKDAKSKYGDVPIWHAFRWENGRMRDLTARGSHSSAGGIDDSGQIVGSITALGRDYEYDEGGSAVLWKNGQRIQLGALRFKSKAVDINDRGKIVGLSHTRDWHEHAVLWTLER
jgi:probable HAF family extracellular repeat protein